VEIPSLGIEQLRENTFVKIELSFTSSSVCLFTPFNQFFEGGPGMLSREDLAMNFPNIRQRTQETPYRAIPLANNNSIIREGGWCCKELANGRYIAELAPMRK
jgi:hypothetical protein